MINNKKIYTKLCYCLIAIIIISFITIIIKNYFTPFFIIIFMFLICRPIYEILYSRKIFNTNISAIITLLFVNTLIFFIFFYAGKIFINSFFYLIKSNYLVSTSEVDKLIHNLGSFLNMDISSFSESIGKFSSKIFYNGYIKEGALYTTDWICAYFIANISVYFILIDRYVIFKTLEIIFPRDKILKFKLKLNQIFKVFKVELFLVVATTIETLFGLIALNINNVIFISVLCGLLDLIPYIGTIIIFVPLTIYYFINKSKIIGVGLILLYILIQITRQIWEAKFVSRNLKIHPLAIIIGIYLGAKIFGIIGLFIAPIYILTIREIILSN